MEKVYNDNLNYQYDVRSEKRLSMVNWNIVKGKRVLDIGCNAGMLTIESAKRGAKLAVGIERSNVIHKGMETATIKNLDNAVFYQFDMESEKAKKIIQKGYEVIFFCAMLNHVKPINRKKFLHLLDCNCHYVMIYETNFEGNVEKHLGNIKKYTSFDTVKHVGESGDRKPEDYNLFECRKHFNFPPDVMYLPTLVVPMENINFYPGNLSHEHADKVDRLAEHINLNGLAQPLFCFRDGNQYNIKEGGHRLLALKQLGYLTVPIKDATEFKSKWKNPHL